MQPRHVLWSIAAALALCSAGAASATTIDKTLTIDVFQVCDTGGGNCAAVGPAGDAYYAAEVNKIWAQAGISVSFDFVQQIDNSNFTNINDGVVGSRFGDLAAAYGTGGPSSTTVDLFLVHTVAGAYGEGWLGAGGLVIAMDTVMAYNGGVGRIDTIAHELGHNLGLVPNSLGGDSGGHTTDPTQLMDTGLTRDIPTSLADIAPGAAGYDVIPAGQAALARQSSLLSDLAAPEPASWTLLLTGIGLGLLARRRAAAG